MRLVKMGTLAAVVLTGIFALGTVRANAQYAYQGGPASYVPPPPGPGYAWVNGYMDNGYWVPGRWVWAGQGDDDDDNGYAAPYAQPYQAPYAAPYAAPYGGYAGDGDGDGDQGGGFWQGAQGILGGVVGGIVGGWGGGDDGGWQGGDDGGDDD